MAVTWNNGLGGWQVDGKGYYASKEAAQAADTTATQAQALPTNTDPFVMPGQMPAPTAPKAPVSTAPIVYDHSDAANRTATINAAPGGYNEQRAASTAEQIRQSNISAQDPRNAPGNQWSPFDVLAPVGYATRTALSPIIGETAASVVGGVVDPFSIPSQTLAAQRASAPAPARVATGPAAAAPTAGGAPPAATAAAQLNAAGEATAEAETDWRDTEADNSAENANLWSNLWDKYDKVDDADYGLSDEARGYQREGLQMQRQLLEKMLGFDPNQYATQFADQNLARMVAAGRSGPGGFAAQQAGIMAANDQAPALFAEGARTAAGLENSRLQAAAGVAKSFGELGTMTRGQDETRAQFDATLPLELAKAMTNATQGQVAMNEQESQRFADIYMNFAQLQATYAGMSSQEQMAWWDREMAEKGLDNQWNMFKQELAQQGKITAKDILGGVFSLGGAAVTGGGSILAARAGRPGK
jgi:hypothetical protein